MLAGDAMSNRFRWGHININVANLDVAMEFYKKLGFEVFMASIPYLNLSSDLEAAMPVPTAHALGLSDETKGRACIMQLHNGLPKLDLTELADAVQRTPLNNSDRGLVRFCLASQDLQADYAHLVSLGVEFLSPPVTCASRMAEVAVCQDPDGTLIELLQVHLERWPRIQPANGRADNATSNEGKTDEKRTRYH